MVRRYVRAAGVVLACVGALSAAGTTAAAARTSAAGTLCTTSQTIKITGLAFQPPAVVPGQSSQADLTAVNCTAQTQQVSAEWLGRFVGSGTGIPPGCPVVDPFLMQLTFTPHQQRSASLGYLVPTSCTATALVVTVRILKQGVVIAQRSAQLTIE